MRRYVTRPQGWWEEGDYATSGTRGAMFGATVMEPEPQTVATGVLDASGNMIYARNEMDPIGFQRLK